MNKDEFAQYPNTVLSNGEVEMKVYLPDPEKGLYRATRFDWSGVIGSVQYKGHEYFGYWKETHDPLFHEDLTGPVEGYIEPGLGYTEAEPGGAFIRIGVGIIQKANETAYDWKETYKILDHGKWTISQGQDWITFSHEINSDFGYGYIYDKTIRLKSNGFSIEHRLKNTGEKTIETDQFNHNFFMIDHEPSGPPFGISFPYNISTMDDPKGYLEINEKELRFIRALDDNTVFLNLAGYSEAVSDHQVTVVNGLSGAGVSYSVDKPLHRMVFWACETTLCPENSIWISVDPAKEMEWTSEYNLFVNRDLN
ncbi:MAG: hypothetical protein V2B15_02470 [Bacteroidota bacterium]